MDPFISSLRRIRLEPELPLIAVESNLELSCLPLILRYGAMVQVEVERPFLSHHAVAVFFEVLQDSFT